MIIFLFSFVKTPLQKNHEFYVNSIWGCKYLRAF
nr:MAG TPA: hypothetical protein [Caudoviricetes sp.]